MHSTMKASGSPGVHKPGRQNVISLPQTITPIQQISDVAPNTSLRSMAYGIQGRGTGVESTIRRMYV